MFVCVFKQHLDQCSQDPAGWEDERDTALMAGRGTRSKVKVGRRTKSKAGEDREREGKDGDIMTVM